MVLDFTLFSLLLTNVLQMVAITWLLLPIDAIALSKSIKNFIENLHRSGWFNILLGGYIFLIAGFGILAPTRTLNSGKIPKILRDTETPLEKVKRITNSANATRNYLLATFSLFYVLVLWRLIEYLEFSAILHEFSNLMGNYDLVDIGEAEAEKEKEEEAEEEIEDEEDPTYIINTDISEEKCHWPSLANLNKKEESRIKQFFRRTPKKGMSKTSLATVNQTDTYSIQNTEREENTAQSNNKKNTDRVQETQTDRDQKKDLDEDKRKQ